MLHACCLQHDQEDGDSERAAEGEGQVCHEDEDGAAPGQGVFVCCFGG